MPSIDKELQDILEPVADRLVLVRDRIRHELASDTKTVQEIIAHVSQYEGKLLRPALVLLTSQLFEGATEELVTVAAIVEMVHLATLVHDDVLDDATVRRRVRSVNADWGTQRAVLLGDYIYARAFHLSTGLRTQTCSRILSDVTRTLCEGEIDEIAATYDFGISESRYLEIIGAKTACLYGAACRLGALYAGATGEQADEVHDYGYQLGLGFQIVDDCLDLAGQEIVVGKSLGTDIAEGKITLPVLELLKMLDEAGRQRVREIFLDRSLQRPLDILHAEFPLASAIELALQKADEFLRRALEQLTHYPSSPYKSRLLSMPEYILAREW